jgi:hypothetical protein
VKVPVVNGRFEYDVRFAPPPEELQNITDGTSNTLLAGESTNWDSGVDTNIFGRRTLWALPWGNYIESQTYAQSRIFLGSFRQCSTFPGQGTEPIIGDNAKVCYSGWFSGHPAGMNFITCDGAGSFISFDVDLQLFATMGSIADEGVY